MPAACAFSWFGDPRSTAQMGTVRDQKGIVGFIPDRDTERRRLRVKYDNQFGDENVIVNQQHSDFFRDRHRSSPWVGRRFAAPIHATTRRRVNGLSAVPCHTLRLGSKRAAERGPHHLHRVDRVSSGSIDRMDIIN